MASDGINSRWDSQDAHDGRYPPDWDARRQAVYERDNWTCQNCDAESGPHAGDDGVPLHAHHIVPRSRGGTNQLSNLTTLCEACHNNAHAHDITGDAASQSTPSIGSTQSTAGRTAATASSQSTSSASSTRSSSDGDVPEGEDKIGPGFQATWYWVGNLVVSIVLVIGVDLVGVLEGVNGTIVWSGIYVALTAFSVYSSPYDGVWERDRDEDTSRSGWTTVATVIGSSVVACAISWVAIQEGAPSGGFGFIVGVLASFTGILIASCLLCGVLGAVVAGGPGGKIGLVGGVLVGIYWALTNASTWNDVPDPAWVSSTVNYSLVLNIAIGCVLLVAVLAGWLTALDWLFYQPVRDRINHGYRTLPALWPPAFILFAYAAGELILQTQLTPLLAFSIPTIAVLSYEARIALSRKFSSQDPRKAGLDASQVTLKEYEDT
ncbi:uncharacterized protein HHUB_4285 (plasmid) [Halobacterium hubeiense]|uniref:HNH nuclease domain-containing protein n=1 Tax=Halobacterium hubeiense TaxID=1407499 RepID=A0A0U5HA08_9EURY|nr:uncharacterized protein HHUB_4285 [Halobacterium hubeiense]